MANLAFTKLGLKKNQEIKTIEYNGQTIEVKQYLPINDKLDLIGQVLTNSQDDNNFANPVKLEVFTKLFIIKFYTNITFTEKQWEDTPKLYDLFIANGLMERIFEVIPRDEYVSVFDAVGACAEAIYKYRNSVMGILDIIKTDYSGLNLEASDIQEKISDINNLNLLRDILTKLG